MKTLPLLALTVGMAGAGCKLESTCVAVQKKAFERIGHQGEAADQLITELCDSNAHISEVTLEIDHDKDGYKGSEDCDDNDREVNPSAAEECDNIDNNCNGKVDADDPMLADWSHYTGIATNTATGERRVVCCDYYRNNDVNDHASFGTHDSKGEMICKLPGIPDSWETGRANVEDSPECEGTGTHSKGLNDHPICIETKGDGDTVSVHMETGIQPGWTVQTVPLPKPVQGDTWATRLARVDH